MWLLHRHVIHPSSQTSSHHYISQRKHFSSVDPIALAKAKSTSISSASWARDVLPPHFFWFSFYIL